MPSSKTAVSNVPISNCPAVCRVPGLAIVVKFVVGFAVIVNAIDLIQFSLIAPAFGRGQRPDDFFIEIGGGKLIELGFKIVLVALLGAA